MAVKVYPEVAGIPEPSISVNYTLINSTTTTTIKAGLGTFFGIVCTAPGTTWSITVWDNTAASGTVLIPATTATAGGITGGLPAGLGVNFVNGLTISSTGTAGTLLILWK